jgi:cardiolipin synthase
VSRLSCLSALLLWLAGCAPAPPVAPARAPLPAPSAGPHAGLLAHHLAQVAPSLTSPLTRGNDATLLVDGPKTHAAMFAAMEAARDHINLETYILEEGEVGERLAQLLARKRRAGVHVNLLYDSVGSLNTSRDYFERLKAAGVAVCEFNPVNPAKAAAGWQLNNRDHRKILVVDGRVAFTGGINISGVYSAGSASARMQKKADEEGAGWRDTHLRVEGPVVAQLQRLFLDGWALQDCGPAPQATYYPPLARRGDKAMRVVAADPGLRKSEMYAVLLSAIQGARQRVWLTFGYFVPDPRTREALVDAARRGVDVRLVLPGFSDFWAPVYAGRSHYAELLEAGVAIYEWRDALMHAKTAVIDSVWASVGSTNLDWRSFVHNYEADVIVYDPAFARALEGRFRLDVEASVEITLPAWRQRGVVERLKEWLARRWEYLL